MHKFILTRAAKSSVFKRHCFRSATSLSNRFVRIENSRFDDSTDQYPTPGRGHDFDMNIFGLMYSVDDINAVQKAIWNKESFLPNQPAGLIEGGPLEDLSAVGQEMAVVLEDGITKGLLSQNMLRKNVLETLNESHFKATMELLREFKEEEDFEQKAKLGQRISDVAFWSQWLIRGVLFEGKLHLEQFCEDVVRAPLSKIAWATNAALGRHQIEFVYDDYTLKAAIFPENSYLDNVNYDNPQEILQAVQSITTPVGFNDMRPGQPEHNFRHNHSLMEHQMKVYTLCSL